MKILLFGELVSSNKFLFFFLEKLHVINIFTNLGSYLQGIPIQNVVDFIWGTDSGIRTLPVSFYLFILQVFFGNNWYWVYIVVIIFFPFFCFLIALRIYKKIDIFVFLGAIFYTCNTWIINRLLSGYWQLNLVYALLPFLIIIPITFANKLSYTHKSLFFWSTLLALFASIVMIAQPHFLIMVSFFLFLHISALLLTKKKQQIRNVLLLYGLCIVEFLFINVYFFVPSTLFPEKLFTAPNQYFSIGSVIFNGLGSTLFHVLQLSPVAYPFVAHQTNFAERVQFMQLLFVLLFFIMKKKKEWLLFLSVVVFIFLGKGLNPPFGQVSNFLYRYIPVLHFFRDPTRFVGAIVLFGSLIIGFFTRERYRNVYSNLLMILLFFFVFFTANWRILSTNFMSTLTETNIPKQYISMQNYINAIGDNRRLLILPNKSGYTGYSFYHDNPLPPSYTLYDMVLPLRLPLADSSNYPDSYSNQMASLAYEHFTESYNTNILPFLGIRYILTDSSITQPIDEHVIATSSAVSLRNQADLQYKKNINNLNFFVYTKNTSLVTTERPIFAIGNLNTIMQIHERGVTRPIILLNQPVNIDSLNKQILQHEELYIDDENALLTLTAEELAGKYAINLLKKVWDYDKSLANCEPYKMSYMLLHGNLFTSGSCVESGYKTGSVDIPLNLSQGRYKVLLKVMSIDAGSQLGITISDKTINKNINTQGKLMWMDLGEYAMSAQRNKIILNVKDTNKIAIDHLAFIPLSVWNSSVRKNDNLLKSMQAVELDKIENAVVTSTVNNIGTNYISVPKTKYLTYRFSWGKWWMSNKPSTSFMSDGYGMTFIAMKDNISSILYIPDYVYSICIIFSLITVIGLIAYVTWYLLYVSKLNFTYIYQFVNGKWIGFRHSFMDKSRVYKKNKKHLY